LDTAIESLKALEGSGMADQGKNSKALPPSQEEAKAKHWWRFWK
jgi:hypothetical protein